MERARGEAWAMRITLVLVVFGFAMCGCSTPPEVSDEPVSARFFLETSNRAVTEIILPQSEAAIKEMIQRASEPSTGIMAAAVAAVKLKIGA